MAVLPGTVPRLRKIRLREVAAEGRSTQRLNCRVPRGQTCESRIAQGERGIDVGRLRRRTLRRITVGAVGVMTGNSDHARGRPTIVVWRGNVRSGKLRGGSVRCGKVRYWGHWGRDFRCGETWSHVRSGRRKMGCRRNHWPLSFRVGHESWKDEGYRTNGNRSHDHKTPINEEPINQSTTDR